MFETPVGRLLSGPGGAGGDDVAQPGEARLRTHLDVAYPPVEAGLNEVTHPHGLQRIRAHRHRSTVRGDHDGVAELFGRLGI